MRRFLFILAVAAVMAGVRPVNAEMYQSSAFDYSVDLPSGWIVLDMQKMRTDPKLMEAAVESANKGPWKTADRSMLSEVRQMVDAGTVEYYVNSKYPGSTIAVNEMNGKLPETDAGILKLCAALPAEITRMAGKPIRVYECGAKSLGGSNAMFVAADAYAEGDKSFQYEIQKSPEELLIFTATCHDQSCNAVREELTSMVNSVSFKPTV